MKKKMYTSFSYTSFVLKSAKCLTVNFYLTWKSFVLSKFRNNSLCKNPPSLYWSHRAFHSHTYLSQVSYNVVVKVVAGASHRTAKVDLPFLLAPHSWVNFCLVSVQLLLQLDPPRLFTSCVLDFTLSNKNWRRQQCNPPIFVWPKSFFVLS